MKTLNLVFLMVAIMAISSFTATTVPLKGNVGQSVPVMGDNVRPVVIDSSEIDTSTRVFDLTDLPFAQFSDTIGTVWMRCDDSAGTDSVAGLLKWQGNPSYLASGPQALWENIDSVAIAVASGVETQTSKAVVISNSYMALRFILRNQLAPAAGKKTVCNNIVLNRHKRMFVAE